MKKPSFLSKIKNNTTGVRVGVKKFLRTFFTVDILPKITCVFAALCLWFYVIGTDIPNYTQTFREVKIEFLTGDSEFEVLSGERNTVEVVISGNRADIISMDSSDIRATVDISQITSAGEYVLDINVTTLNETSVEDRNPKSMYVYIDKSSSRSVMVKADYSGGTSNDKALKIGELEPSKTFITVYGPEETISNIDYADVSVDLQLISNSVNLTKVPIKLIDKNGNEINNQYIRTEPSNLDVYVPVYMEKTVNVKPQYLHNYFDDQHINAIVNPQTVTIKGEIETVSSLNEIYTMPIDETTVGKSRTLQIDYALPEGTAIVGARGKCNVTLQIDDYVEKQITVNPAHVEFVGLPDVLSATATPVNITICGVSRILSYLTLRDFKVVADLTSMTEGEHKDIPISVSFASNDIRNVYIKNADYKITANIFEVEDTK